MFSQNLTFGMYPDVYVQVKRLESRSNVRVKLVCVFLTLFFHVTYPTPPLRPVRARTMRKSVLR